MDFAFVLVGFLVLSLTISYFVILFLWPEWVGISGRDTKEILESHKETAEMKKEA